MTQPHNRIIDVKNLISLCSIDVNPKSNVNDSLIHLGKRNGVGAWCYKHLNTSSMVSKSENKLLKAWEREYHETSRINDIKLGVFLKIQEILKKADIPVVALRGFAMAFSNYDNAGLRPTGNLEVLVPEGKAMQALTVLLNAGAHTVSAPLSSLHEQVQAHIRYITFRGVQIVIYQRLFSLGSPFHVKTNLFENVQCVDAEGSQIKVLDDVLMGYHLTAYVASHLDHTRIRIGWLLDLALLFDKQNNLSEYLEQIRNVNPSQTKMLEHVFKMTMLFLPNKINQYDGRMPSTDFLVNEITQAIRKRKHASKYQKIGVQQVMNVSGVHNKIGLLWHEIFPSKEFMIDKYQREDKMMLGLYIKHIFGM